MQEAQRFAKIGETHVGREWGATSTSASWKPPSARMAQTYFVPTCESMEGASQETYGM